MNGIFTIAKRDFISHIYSVKAGLIFWVFLMFIGVFFQAFISTYMQMQQSAPMMGGQAPTLEQLVKAIFANTHFILMFIVPGLTMGAFAEEKRLKTFRLLQTAPVTSMEIVLGKFLANAGLMLLVLVAAMIYPGFLMKYGNPDIGPIWTSFAGFFLLICAQVAFGLWISSMTETLLIAYFGTLFALFLLLILTWIAPSLTGNGVMESFLKYIAFSNHLEQFMKGIVSVSAVVYFMCFTALFLFFTNVVLDSQRWR